MIAEAGKPLAEPPGGILATTGKVYLIILTGTVDNEEAGYQSRQGVPAFGGLLRMSPKSFVGQLPFCWRRSWLSQNPTQSPARNSPVACDVLWAGVFAVIRQLPPNQRRLFLLLESEIGWLRATT